MRNKGFFYRTDDETTTSSNATSDCPDWLGSFAESEAIKEGVVKTASAKTAVEVARDRSNNQRSLFEMMSAIMGNATPSKFSSVEEVVKDYQARTGLNDHITRKQAADGLEALAKMITEGAKKEEAKKDAPADMASLKEKAQKLCAKIHGAKAADVTVTFEKKEDKFVAVSQCKGKVKSKPCDNKREALNNLIDKLKAKVKDKKEADVANAADIARRQTENEQKIREALGFGEAGDTAPEFVEEPAAPAQLEAEPLQDLFADASLNQYEQLLAAYSQGLELGKKKF